MKLQLIREILDGKRTHGKLFVNGQFMCYTLEDTDRYLEVAANKKVDSESAIPVGKYEVIIDRSVRFGRNMPHILDVPRFAGIRIHSGNTEQDTEGCIILGLVRANDRVLRSRDAYTIFFRNLQGALNGGEKVTIEVSRA